MDNKKYKKHYSLFKEDDLHKSTTFKTSLNLSEQETTGIDSWFNYYLEQHHDYHSPESWSETQQSLKAYHQKLTEAYNQLISTPNKQTLKYLLGKLIKYYNITQSGYLLALIVPAPFMKTFISEYIDQKKTIYTAQEFVALTYYLQESVIFSPNGDLLTNILKIESKHKICTKATSQERTAILTNLLSIVNEIDYHHDIKVYKKVLSLVKEEDHSFIEYIYDYTVKCKQGCYILLNVLFAFDFNLTGWEDFAFKKELINWLDTSRGSTPTPTWLDKFQQITEKAGITHIQKLSNEILNREDLKSHFFNADFYWRDDIIKRFLKGAGWIEAQIQ